MCRFVAYIGPPTTLEALLLDRQHSLLRQAHRPRHQHPGAVNVDGFGAGWYAHDTRVEPAVYRSTRPIWAEASFVSIAGVIETGALLAAVRDASPFSTFQETDVPPFSSDRYLFVHNGRVEGFRDGAAARLRRTLTERRESAITGSTDSEVLFAMVLDRIDSGLSLPDSLADTVNAVHAVADASLNLVLHDGHTIAATASGNSLFVLTDDQGPSVTIASEPLEKDARWQPVPQGSLVVATPERVATLPLDPSAARAAP